MRNERSQIKSTVLLKCLLTISCSFLALHARAEHSQSETETVTVSKMNKVVHSRAGRLLSLSCAMLFSMGHYSKAIKTIEDPIRNPYKPFLWIPSVSRRGTIESLLSVAFKKNRGASGVTRRDMEEEEDFIAPQEMIVQERTEDRLTGYLLLSNEMLYFVAELNLEDGKIHYSVFDSRTENVIEAGVI